MVNSGTNQMMEIVVFELTPEVFQGHGGAKPTEEILLRRSSPQFPLLGLVPACPHMPPHLSESAGVAKMIHFIYRSLPDLCGGSVVSIVVREKWVETEMLDKESEELAAMWGWTELIGLVLGECLSFFKHPVGSVFFISIPFPNLFFHTIPQMI